MLPDVANTDDLILEFESESEKDKTFYLNTHQNVVGGLVDEVVALHQSIYLKLSTEADQFIIYPYTYGLVTIDLIGKPHYYVMAVLPDRIKDALLSDDRIIDVSDFEFETLNKKLHVTFRVHTIYGDITEETVVEL